MLVVTEIEVIFFTVAGMGLYFGILAKTGMFSLLLISAFAASRPFLLLIPPARRLGMHKDLGGDTAVAADPK